MIRSFKDQRAAEVFEGHFPKFFPSDLVAVARRKLRMLHRATNWTIFAFRPPIG